MRLDMHDFKKPLACKGCTEPAGFTFKEIKKGESTCYSLCTKCPLREKLLDLKTEVLACPNCSRTLQEVQTSKTVGCIDCYTTFKDTCQSLFQSMNLSEFSPHANYSEVDIQELRSSLQEAIANELFEEAAMIRDRLKQMTSNSGGL